MFLEESSDKTTWPGLPIAHSLQSGLPTLSCLSSLAQGSQDPTSFLRFLQAGLGVGDVE